MWRTGICRYAAVVGLFGLALGLLAACSTGVSKSEYDSVKQQLEAQEQRTANLQQQLSTREKEASDLQAKASTAPAAQPAAGTLIGVKQVPPPTPRPPASPGAAAAPRPAMPASYNEPLPFTFYVETLATTTASTFGFASTVSCTPNSVFQRGMRLVWRFEIVDLATGKRVTDQDGATVKLQLPHGEELTGRFSQRAGGRVPDAPWMWSANWDIPLDFPLGGLDYTISIATKDGRSFTWKTPAIVSPETDSRVKIIA
jgi:hypothetical protein